MLGPEVHASLTCVGFTNDPHSLTFVGKRHGLVSPWPIRTVNTSALDPRLEPRHGTTAARAQVRQLRSRHPSIPLCAYGLMSLSTVSRLPKPPSPRLPTTTQSRSNRSGGHHRSRHATDHSVLPSRHDARRCGCPAAPNHLGRALWRKAGKSLHPPKEPPTPPKEPLYPPQRAPTLSSCAAFLPARPGRT